MKTFVGLLLILLAASAVRMDAAMKDQSVPEKDGYEYDRLALDLVRGEGYRNEQGQPSAWRAPLYPFFLAAVYKIAGHSYLWVRIFQALLSAATVFFIFLSARVLFGEKAGWCAGVLAAFYPPFFAYDFSSPAIATETLYTFFLVFFFYALARFLQFRSVWAALAAGFALGLASLTRPVPLALAVLLPFILGLARMPLRPLLGFTFLSALSFAAILAPWTFRNYKTFHAFVPVSTIGGANFYLTNHPGADGMGGPLEFYRDVYYPADRALDAMGKNEIEKSRYFYEEAKKTMVENPRESAQLLFRKARLFMDPRIVFEQNGRPIRAISWFYLLALGGTLASWMFCRSPGFSSRERQALILLTLLFAYFLAIHIVTASSVRFRLPAEPLLIVMASCALSKAGSWLVTLLGPRAKEPAYS